MEKSNLKNIVVLKNLPSNLVDEAIVILKPNKRIKKIEVVNKNSKTFNKINTTEGYVLKEAEMLVANYVSKLENKEKIDSNKNIKMKYRRLKRYSLLISIILIISLLANFIL